MKRSSLFIALTFAAGCSDTAGPPAATADAVSADTTQVADSADVIAPVGPPLAAARGLVWRRNVVHIHSAFSHDACDNWISDHDGEVNQTCVLQLREGLCASGLDVAFMTDHPGRMKDHTFDELLFLRPDLGDKPVGPAGKHHANVIHCATSAVLPAHDIVVTVGYEGTHDMAGGLHSHFADGDLEGLSFADESTTLPEAQSAVAAIHEVKGLSLNAHSEEDDITVQRLVDVGIDAMEIYNIHANFKTIVGMSAKGATGNIGRVLELDKFLGDPALSPHPDLALMVMLDVQPEAAFTKFQAVNAQRRVTAVVGNDVHQNVNLDGFCTPGGSFESMCEGLAEAYPNLVKMLKKGGPVMLADGRRIDDYTRALRWISNHSLLPADTATADLAEATKAAIAAGRTWAVFDALGDPEGLDWLAQNMKTGQWVEAGATVPLGSALWLRLPTACKPMPWAPWQVADTLLPGQETQVIAHVWRIEPGQAEAKKFVTVTGQWGSSVKIVPDQPGRYHVELRIVPRHLRTALKTLGDFADKEQRWAVGNVIEIQ